MCHSALPLKPSYLDVIIYMAGKMAKNMFFIVFNNSFESINRVCFDHFAVKGITEFWSLKKYVDDSDGVAQDGGGNSNNSLAETCSLCLLCTSRSDIGHPCYDQLTPVKKRHPLTRIM